MKKILLILSVMVLAFGCFAKGNFDKVNTVYTNVPVKIMFQQDSIFDVVVRKSNENYIRYEVVNDSVLKITYNGFRIETNDETPVIKIKTPKPLNVECSRYLRIH